MILLNMCTLHSVSNSVGQADAPILMLLNLAQSEPATMLRPLSISPRRYAFEQML
jgi:hypothetical protein